MKRSAFLAVVSAIFGLFAFAAPAGAMHAMMMPSCASGDPVVGVNTMTKMYMTHEQMKMRMAGMSHSQMHAMMMRNHVKLMCMSRARQMGATMMHPRM